MDGLPYAARAVFQSIHFGSHRLGLAQRCPKKRGKPRQEKPMRDLDGADPVGEVGLRHVQLDGGGANGHALTPFQLGSQGLIEWDDARAALVASVDGASLHRRDSGGAATCCHKKPGRRVETFWTSHAKRGKLLPTAKLRRRMLTFVDFVKHRLGELGWSGHDLALAMGYNGNWGVYEVLNGGRKPPLKRIDDWAKALKLDDEQRITLRSLAEREHVPLGMRARLARLEAQVEKLKELGTALAAENKELLEENRQLRARVSRVRSNTPRPS
jgi:hypothetical protein